MHCKERPRGEMNQSPLDCQKANHQLDTSLKEHVISYECGSIRLNREFSEI